MSENLDDITDDLPPDDAAEEQAPEPDHAAAEEADQFTLAPDGWVDAEKFLTLPSTQLKISRDLQREMRAELAETKARAERAERMSLTVAERAREQERQKYEEQIAELRKQQRDAASIGDLETYDAIGTRVERMAPPKVEPVAPQPDDQPPEVKAFIAANPWTQDPQAARFAFELIETTPGAKALPPERQLAFADQKVREFFPEKFQTQAPRAPAKVDGGGLGGISTKQSYSARLPADVAKAGRDFVKQGIFKDIEEYARDYFEGN
jgi:hypothetical protein